MTEEWLGRRSPRLWSSYSINPTGDPEPACKQNERCASGGPPIQLREPGGDAELGLQALKTSTIDLEQTKEKQFHPESKYTKGLHLRRNSTMSKAPLILATGQDGKCCRVSLPVNGAYPREVCSELPVQRSACITWQICTVANDCPPLSCHQSLADPKSDSFQQNLTISHHFYNDHCDAVHN